MLALYRSGRTPEALEVYESVRSRFAEDLGIDPDPALRRRQAAILRDDPGLMPSPAPSPPAATPAHLPAPDAEVPR